MTQNQWLKLMTYGRRLGCHQLAERSFFFRGFQFPVCARCTGVFIASIISLPVFFFYELPIFLCVILSGIMFADWFVQRIGLLPSTNVRRFVTGLAGGYGYATLYYHLFKFLFLFLKKIILN
ncbi:DUF2085 domain-containing protein [Treponema zioleckii]|uniref:DUF2085 domain-containing protein n=1 Tax=Treponema zioleckii TaxID=331680 RepID=UPI00168BE226|nr:DUF2085 domain-containing protein [Treponema zioleckii]